MQLTRDKNFIQKNLYVKDNQIYTKEKTIIEVPKLYETKNLISIKDEINVYGIFAIIMNDKYSVSLIPTLLTTTPIDINEIDRNGETYLQFLYGKDSVLINSTNVIQYELMVFDFFEMFFLQAKIPWFIEYEDLIKILDNSEKYAKSKLGSNYIATEIIVSYITKLKEDKTKFYRQNPNKEYAYVDLMDVYHSVQGTLLKLAGNYFTESLTSAIVQKEKEPTKLTNIVRR